MRRPIISAAGVAGTVIVLAALVAVAPVGAQDTSSTTTPSASTTSAPTTAAPTTSAPASSTTAAPAPDATTSTRPPPPQYERPGVYVDELPGDESIVASSTSVTAFVGAGSIDVSADDVSAGVAPHLQIDDYGDFAEQVQGASPALSTAVEQFFVQGGLTAYVAVATDETTAGLVDALDGTVAQLAEWDLLVVPAMAALDQDGWTQVATTMGRLADAQDGTALLDPPTSVVASGGTDWVSTLGDWVAPLRGPDAASMAMLSSGLTDDDGAAVSSASVFAGIAAATDAESGVWTAGAGPAHPLSGLEPAATVDNATSDDLVDQGINPIVELSHYGTVVMGDRTIDLDDPQDELSRQRTIDMVERSIRTGLEPYVFAANDPQTWGTVDATISGFLAELWEQGALRGETAAEAFTVTVGMGTTMTSQDVLDGELIVDVVLNLGGAPAELTFTQQMQGNT
jgi:hypothetical protein